MTRIASLPVSEWDPQLRDLAQADTLPADTTTTITPWAADHTDRLVIRA